MITLGPFTYIHDENMWECPTIHGGLCHTGLTNALDTELETSNQYELRVYEKRPRTDVSELKLEKRASGWYHNDGRRIVDESGERHEVDGYFIDFIEKQLFHLKNDQGEITFYVRPLDLGAAPKEITDVDFDEEAEEVILTATDGTYARVGVDLEAVEWE